MAAGCSPTPRGRLAAALVEAGALDGLSIGFRQVKGLGEAEMTALVAARGAGYDSVRDLWLRSGQHIGEREVARRLEARRGQQRPPQEEQSAPQTTRVSRDGAHPRQR